MGATDDEPIDVDGTPAIRREDSEEEGFNLQDVPEAEDSTDLDALFVDHEEPSGSKRRRSSTNADQDNFSAYDSAEQPLPKRQRDATNVEDDGDDKKKMAMETTYDGFSIYGRVLCLVVKKKDKKGKNAAVTGGQVMMEDWITSTQMPILDD